MAGEYRNVGRNVREMCPLCRVEYANLPSHIRACGGGAD
jgi:hypothetical protein